MKIMIIGSSRSVNTFQYLYEVFRDQMPEEDLTLGIMYHSGCSMSMHVNFIKNQEAACDYYLNNDGYWNITKGVTTDVGIADQPWDVVFLQAGRGDTDNEMNRPDREFLVDFVNGILKTPHVFWWHSTWFNAEDPDLYAEGKKEKAAKVDQVAQLAHTNESAVKYVLHDPMFAGHIASGTPMLYARKVLGLQDRDILRDHTHLSDFGYLIAAYSFYAQFTGKPVTKIGLDKIPAHLRHKKNRDLGDMEITEEMKDIVLKAVAYTLENPWAVPTGK